MKKSRKILSLLLSLVMLVSLLGGALAVQAADEAFGIFQGGIHAWDYWQAGQDFFALLDGVFHVG